MKLYLLGKVPWELSQLLYHAMADLGREALLLLSPSSPYVCIGFHQDAQQELDLGFCREQGFPVFRREVGGGAVYLDGNQLFFQLVFRANNPLVPKRKESFYQTFLDPVIRTYERIGIPARYKPINDILCGTRKISGTGAGEIGPSIVFVGNLILDFDHETMSRVLRVPDEKFRDKVHRTLRENLTTIRRELGPEKAQLWDETRLSHILAEEFAALLGPLEPASPDAALLRQVARRKAWMLDHGWILGTRKKGEKEDRILRIRSGTQMLHRLHKAPGGLIRADFALSEGRYQGVRISGDFFCFPPQAVSQLEDLLEGRTPQELEAVLEAFYSGQGVETPGVGVQDWVHLLRPLANKAGS